MSASASPTLGRLSFVANAENVLLFGRPASAIHLAIALDRAAVEHGHSSEMSAQTDTLRTAVGTSGQFACTTVRSIRFDSRTEDPASRRNSAGKLAPARVFTISIAVGTWRSRDAKQVDALASSLQMAVGVRGAMPRNEFDKERDS